MKKYLRVLSIVLALALAICGLCACTATKEGDNKLIMATNAAFPPYEYYEGETIVGIDAEVGALIAEKLGMELEIVDMDFNGILGAIQSGVADIGLAGMTVTEKRLESVNFSVSYAKGVQVVIVKEDSAIATLDDLAEATTGDIYATDELGEDKIKRYQNGAAAVEALQSGIVDAVIIDNEPAKAFVADQQGLTILETAYADEDYAIAVAKENTELLDKINTALGELIADGSVEKIVNKYIPA